MSEHNIRRELASADPGFTSSVNGELLPDRDVYGAHYIIATAGNTETRKIPAPAQLGQKMQFSVQLASGHTFTIPAPSGTTFEGTNATLTFTQASGQLWATLESFNIAGTLMWRVTAKGTGVTITT